MMGATRWRVFKVRGFTLVEMLIAIVVLGLLVTIAAPSMYDFILIQRLKSINAQVVTDMQLARSEAAARNLNVRVRFSTTSADTCYVLYTGRERQCDCAANPVCPDARETEIRTVREPRDRRVTIELPGPPVEFYFEAATGQMSPVASDSILDPTLPFRIDTAIDTPRKLRTVIKRSGRPAVCSPPGAVVNPVPCA